MTRITSRDIDASTSGVVDARDLSVEEIDALVHELRAADWKVAMVDVAPGASKDDLFLRLELAFDFPGYFGHNWDAVRDCSLDISWLPARRYCMLLSVAPGTSPSTAVTLTTLLEIADEAHRIRSDAASRFAVVTTSI
jgi:RNAse (barnase) inhibitor barstar